MEASLPEPITDFSSVTFALTASSYTQLILSFEEESSSELCACIPICLRDNGILVAIPQELVADSRLAESEAADFIGTIGPHLRVEVALRSAKLRALKRTTEVLLVDLSVPPMADFHYTLHPIPTGEDSISITPFFLENEVGLWLDHRSLVSASRTLLDQAGDRTSGYATGLEAPQTKATKPRAFAKVSASPATTGVPALFSEEATRLGLSAEQMQHLLSISGRAPTQLKEPARESLAATGQLPATGSDAVTPRGDPVLPTPLGLDLPVDTDPTIAALLKFSAAQMTQQSKMLELLMLDRQKEASLEDLLTAGGSNNANASSSSEGLRGFAAREAWKNYLAKDPTTVRKEVRDRVAVKLGIPTSELSPLSMKEFFEQKVPLASNQANHRLMTQLAMLASRGWELVEREDLESLKTLPSLIALFVEQLSIDCAYKGESELPWFLTGLPLPAFNRTAENRKPQSEEPFAQLANPRWIHANLQYLKDLDFYAKRQSEIVGKSQPSVIASASPKRRRRPKAKAQA